MTDDYSVRHLIGGDHIGYVRLVLYNDSTPSGGFSLKDCDVIKHGRISCFNESSGKPAFARQTSLRHTIIKAMIAAHAREFRDTHGSTMSELVLVFKELVQLFPNCYQLPNDC